MSNVERKKMNQTKKKIDDLDDEEKQLSLLIKQAGSNARKHRKKIMNEHFDKLHKIIEAAKHTDPTISI
jgi:fructose-1,6-bisphosphatase